MSSKSCTEIFRGSQPQESNSGGNLQSSCNECCSFSAVDCCGVFTEWEKSLAQRRAPLGVYEGIPRPHPEHFENKMLGNAIYGLFCNNFFSRI